MENPSKSGQAWQEVKLEEVLPSEVWRRDFEMPFRPSNAFKAVKPREGVSQARLLNGFGRFDGLYGKARPNLTAYRIL